MALNVACPQCQNGFSVSEIFPGTQVFCPNCSACLILALHAKGVEKGFVVKRTAGIVSPTQRPVIQKQALSHLERWLDIPANEIEGVLRKLEEQSAYTLWTIPKGNGGAVREIATPCEPLKNLQRRILDRLLYRIPVSNAAHGFVPGRSIVTNAQYHLKTAGALLNLDLKDAFPSVHADRVKHLYVRYVKIPLKHMGESVAPSVLDEVVEMLVKFTTLRNCLPQGGPCSGYLLNLACITLDKNIYRLLKNYGESYRYTRYADDITISAPSSISPELQKEVQKLVHNCGFQVNPRKCCYWECVKGQTLKVTGLVLEKNKVRIPAAKLEAFRAIIYQAGQVAPENLPPEKRLEIQSIIAFVKMVYNRVPHRIWSPYQAYLEKHGLAYPKKASKMYLDLYPKN